MQTSVNNQPGGGWARTIIHRNEYSPYLVDGHDFIDDQRIQRQLEAARSPEKTRVYDILAKARSLQRLEPSETAVLLNVTDAEVWEDMYSAAGDIKNAVYGPRVVTFAPLYCSNRCVNSCLYCGFRCENREMKRRVLSLDEVREETASLVSRGHKRLVCCLW